MEESSEEIIQKKLKRKKNINLSRVMSCYCVCVAVALIQGHPSCPFQWLSLLRNRWPCLPHTFLCWKNPPFSQASFWAQVHSHEDVFSYILPKPKANCGPGVQSHEAWPYQKTLKAQEWSLGSFSSLAPRNKE